MAAGHWHKCQLVRVHSTPTSPRMTRHCYCAGYSSSHCAKSLLSEVALEIMSEGATSGVEGPCGRVPFVLILLLFLLLLLLVQLLQDLQHLAQMCLVGPVGAEGELVRTCWGEAYSNVLLLVAVVSKSILGSGESPDVLASRRTHGRRHVKRLALGAAQNATNNAIFHIHRPGAD